MGNSGDLSDCGFLFSGTDLKICGGEVSDHGRVLDWEDGLPYGDDLTPLSFHLVPPNLASAFQIPPADLKTVIDVQRATQITISSLNLSQKPPSSSSSSFSSSYALDGCLKPFNCPAVPETGDLDESRLPAGEDSTAAKRPRLVWSPQLHKRFVDAVSHLGIKKSVPKTIMELMNVEGLTRENVASHLQKYRLYLKRMQGFSEDAPSPSPPVAEPPQKLCDRQQTKSIPVQYTVPIMIPMPIYTIPNDQSHGLIPLSSFQGGGALFHGFKAQDTYRMNN